VDRRLQRRYMGREQKWVVHPNWPQIVFVWPAGVNPGRPGEIAPGGQAVGRRFCMRSHRHGGLTPTTHTKDWPGSWGWERTFERALDVN
jgi:hypothetical protein